MNSQIENLKLVLLDSNRHNINYCILRNYEFLLGKPFPPESLDTTIAEEEVFQEPKLYLKTTDSSKKENRSFPLSIKLFQDRRSKILQF